MQIHGDDVIRAGAREEVCNQRTSLSNPRPVTDLVLKDWRLGSLMPHDAIHSIGSNRSMLAMIIRLVRLARIKVFYTILLGRAVGARIGTISLVEFHAIEMIMYRRGTVRETWALSLARVRCRRD